MPVGIGSVGWESVIRFGVGLAPKRCSHQAEFHHILSRRSPCGTDLGEMSEGRVERRLAAILAADVAGYSRLMGTDEEGTLAALRAVRRELADPKIAEHRGRIVKTTGDGLLVEFASVVDAVRCAVEVQREMIARNAATPAQRRIEFRMGINVGDIIIEDGDIFGNGVNIAARLEAWPSRAVSACRRVCRKTPQASLILPSKTSASSSSKTLLGRCGCSESRSARRKPPRRQCRRSPCPTSRH